MCGIAGIFDLKTEGMKQRALEMGHKVRHRGPDWRGSYEDEHIVMAHERLSIIDPESGAQPLIDSKSENVLAVNGEIYDYKDQIASLKKKHEFKTQSDCEVLLYLYDEQGIDFLPKIDGIFSFILYDKEKKDVFVARDHIGIIPLYIGWDTLGQTYVASEMKSLDPYCPKIQEFPPGHYYQQSTEKFVRWYEPDWRTKIPDDKFEAKKLRAAMEKAVTRQMMSDVPFGVLISGGLDSSIIAAIAQKNSEEKLYSFSIGLEGSPDLAKAKVMADFIGTKHHSLTYTIEEGVDAIREVIHHLETFDTTTIRAATPMFLMARKIKSYGIKMVLSGEGADEVFGGYLYFHHAPNPKEMQEELVEKLSKLSKYDCLRANKSLAAWGVEGRVPFLDREFLEVAMNIDPFEKMPGPNGKYKIEKHILREACKDLMPDEITWRQKEQFSDGVGYGWIDSLKEIAEKSISDQQMKDIHHKFPDQTPTSKEQYLYREMFDSMFKSPSAAKTVPVGKSVACSTPRAAEWIKASMDDPSGRAIGVHVQKY